jgi:hypothetical protein
MHVLHDEILFDAFVIRGLKGLYIGDAAGTPIFAKDFSAFLSGFLTTVPIRPIEAQS